MHAETVKVDLLTEGDAVEVAKWPTYPTEYEALDYALRKGGWLDKFPEDEGNHRFAARVDNQLVGFSILVPTGRGDAEFFIAVHPKWVGRGVGTILTEDTVKRGFTSLGLEKIHLKVRHWHSKGIELYKKVGFRTTEEKEEEWYGKRIRFLTMYLYKLDWKNQAETLRANSR
jgi:diamine N-acetyltransferase